MAKKDISNSGIHILNLTSWRKVETDVFQVDPTAIRSVRNIDKRKAKCIPINYNTTSNITPLEIFFKHILEIKQNRKLWAIERSFHKHMTDNCKLSKSKNSSYKEELEKHLAEFEVNPLLSCKEIGQAFSISKVQAWRLVKKLEEKQVLKTTPVFIIREHSDKNYCKKVNRYLLEQQANFIEFNSPMPCHKMIKYTREILKSVVEELASLVSKIENGEVIEDTKPTVEKIKVKRLRPEYEKERIFYIINSDGEVVAEAKKTIKKVNYNIEYSRTYTNNEQFEVYGRIDDTCRRYEYDILDNGLQVQVSDKQVTLSMVKLLEGKTNLLIQIGKEEFIGNRATCLNVYSSKTNIIKSIASWKYDFKRECKLNCGIS